MKTGDHIFTYGNQGTGKYEAELVGKFEDPDYGELIDTSDVEREINKENTQFEKWEIRFIGDPPDNTSSRWIHPKDVLPATRRHAPAIRRRRCSKHKVKP